MVPLGPGGQPRQCPGPVTRCGLVLRQRFDGRPPEAWLAFACDEHFGVLVAARELLDRDRAVLDEWRAEERHTSSAERPWRAPQPLATGAEAVALVERARRWAERHRPTRGE
jgi:hypothetical protein